MLKLQSAVALAAGLVASVAMGQTLRNATVVLKIGDTPIAGDPRTVSAIYSPVTDRDGKVAFTGRLIDELAVETAFVWRDSGIVWLDTDAPSGYTISGQPEESCGAGPAGQWAYSNSTLYPGAPSSGDSIWVNGQFLAGARQPTPGITDKFFTFLSGPALYDDGSLTFVAGFANTAGGSTVGRALYHVYFDTPTPTWNLIFKTGDTVAGKTLRFATPGLQFAYDFSDDGLHHIHVLGLDPSSIVGTQSNIYLDGSILAYQGGPIDGTSSGSGASWKSFSSIGVNNAGTAIIMGLHDQFQPRVITVGNTVWLHQDDTLTGTSGLLNAPLACSINNAGKIAHSWSVDNGLLTLDKLIAVGDAAQLGVDSVIIAQTRDTLDTNNDGNADYTLDDITTSVVVTRGIDFGDDGDLYFTAKITPIAGGVTRDAILKFHVYDPCPCSADFDASGGTPDASDIDAFFTAWLLGDPTADADCSGGTPDASDIDTFFLQWLNGGC